MIIALLLYLLLSVGGLTLFKLGASRELVLSVSDSVLKLHVSFLSLVGCLCYILSFLLYLGIISKYNVSYVFPIATGCSCILAMLASVYLLHESVSLTNWIGVLLITAGILLVYKAG